MAGDEGDQTATAKKRKHGDDVTPLATSKKQKQGGEKSRASQYGDQPPTPTKGIETARKPAFPYGQGQSKRAAKRRRAAERRRSTAPTTANAISATLDTAKDGPHQQLASTVETVGDASALDQGQQIAQGKNGKKRKRSGFAALEVGLDAVRDTRAVEARTSIGQGENGEGQLSGRSVNEQSLMRVKHQHETDTLKPWTLSSPIGGRYLDHDPVFVQDSNGQEYIVAATAHECVVLSLRTSLPACSLPAPSGTSVISFDAITGETDSPIHIVYSNGKAAVWDWKSSSNDEPTFIQHDIQHFRITNHNEGETRVYATWKNLSSKIYFDKKQVYETRKPIKELQVYGDLEFVVGNCGDAVIIGRRGPSEEMTWIEIPLQMAVTCLHARIVDTSKPGKQKQHASTALSLALGNAEGQVHLYSDISSLFRSKAAPTLPTPRILHWHRNAVSSVKFSQDGNYLISGGKETVLVIWQLETGQRNFLPHLTSKIERIVVNPTGNKYAVQMGDNSIMVLSTTELRPVANFAGLQLPTSLSRSLDGNQSKASRIVAALHPQHKSQLLLAVPSTLPKEADDLTARPILQTFDHASARHIARQALSRNNVTDFNVGPERVPIIPPDVQLLAISQDGQWLATVDEWLPPRRDVEHISTDSDQADEAKIRRQEVYLKFWSWDVDQELWTLNSRVDGPHALPSGAQMTGSSGKVFKLISDPSRPGFVSLGNDSTVRIWRPRKKLRHGVPLKNQRGEDEVEWVCRSSIELEQTEERTNTSMVLDAEVDGPGDAVLAISEDGSLIAASMCGQIDGDGGGDIYTSTLSFIDVLSGEIKACKDNIAAPELVELAFMDRYLIALSRKTLRIWDIVDDALFHSIKVPFGGPSVVPLLAVNRVDNTLSIATEKQDTGEGLVRVIGLKTLDVLCSLTLDHPVSALLADNQGRDYVVVSADATIRTLSAGIVPRIIMEDILQAPTDELMEDSEQDSAKVTSDVKQLLAPLPVDEAPKRGLILEETEDDRAVIRPEQLAKIFDSGPGVAALLSVKDMFRAVTDLFARKPRMAMVM